MNFMVVGLGSMGKRRVRLLKRYIDTEVPEIEKGKWSICGVDSNGDRCDEVRKLYAIHTYDSVSRAADSFGADAAVISTAPLSHSSIIEDCLNRDMHVFSEINLVDDGYEDNIHLASKRGKTLFLSSTPIYRREMKYIIDEAHERGFKGTYRYHIGQYLPEWHPWESYKDFFVGDKQTNGCREIFSIELPWLTRAYGKVIGCASFHSKTTDLDIEYDDTFQVILKHDTGVTGSLTVDVSTPKTERAFSAWEEGYYLEWNGTPDSFIKMDTSTGKLFGVYLYDDIEHVEGYNNFVVENAYYDELKSYISCLCEGKKPEYSFEEDMTVLRTVDEIMK